MPYSTVKYSTEKYRNLRCHWPLLCYLLQEFFWYWSTWGVNDKKIFFQKLETKCSKFDHWKVRKKSILVMCLISENNQGKVLFCGRENGILLTRHTVGRKTNSTHSFSWWRWIVGFFGSGSEAKKDFFSGRASRKQPAPEKMFQKEQVSILLQFPPEWDATFSHGENNRTRMRKKLVNKKNGVIRKKNGVRRMMTGDGDEKDISF